MRKTRETTAAVAALEPFPDVPWEMKIATLPNP